MSRVEWQTGIPTGNHLATYRGIRVVIKLSKTGSPTEIRWYIDRLLAESTPLDCDLESAKKIGIDLADRRIPMDDRWRQAEKKDQESSRHQRPQRRALTTRANKSEPLDREQSANAKRHRAIKGVPRLAAGHTR